MHYKFLKKLFQILWIGSMTSCFSAEVHMKVLRGKEIVPFVEDITELCLMGYREYPYLYEGTASEYGPFIQNYADSPNGIVCLLFDGDRPIGVATGLPMAEMRERFQAPFKHTEVDLFSLFYLGELIVSKEYRKRGYASQLCFELERCAKETGRYSKMCFCTIKEPENHSLRPIDYKSVQDGWRGYAKHEEILFFCHWLCVGETEESDHPMVYWIKDLTLERFRKAPKAELHLHLGGSYPYEYLLSIATPEQKQELHESLEWIGRKVDYHEAFKIFNTVNQIVDTEEKVEKGVASLCSWFEADGVVYAEIRTGLRDLGHGHEEYLQAVLRGLEAASKNVEVRLLLSLKRSSNLEFAKNTIDLAFKHRERGIVGIDISGDSTIGEIDAILPEILRAKQQGLFISLHIGESAKEKKQIELLKTLSPDRVGHAVFLEPEALQWILDNRIPIEACLTSSMLVQMTEEYASHPALKYHLQGHPIAICTDDPLIFRIDLSLEFQKLMQLSGMSADTIDHLARSSLDLAFLTEEEKEKLRKKYLNVPS